MKPKWLSVVNKMENIVLPLINHEFVTPRSKYKLASQTKILAFQAAEAELANHSKISFEFMSKQVGAWRR